MNAAAHDLVDPKNRSNVDTCVDVAASIERIKDDTIFPPVLFFYNDSIFELFRDEIGCSARRAQRVDHDIV